MLDREFQELREDMDAFDDLPVELRRIMNYADISLSPQYIFERYVQTGLEETIEYLTIIQNML